MKALKVNETFISLQGESTYSGIPCFFIRLAGCNLRCSYCDTQDAWGEGISCRAEDLLKEAADSRCRLVEVTGGEPLMQDAAAELLRGLAALEGVKTIVETNGTMDISVIPEGVSAIMDIKCPSSGQSEKFDWANVERLRKADEVKFVVAGRPDYEWACSTLREHDLPARCNAVLLGAVHGQLDEAELAEWICEDRLEARFQLQLHKVLGKK